VTFSSSQEQTTGRSYEHPRERMFDYLAHSTVEGEMQEEKTLHIELKGENLNGKD